MENVPEIRLTVTGDTERTMLWIAEDRRSARPVKLETAEGTVELEMYAGQQKLPSTQIRTDEPWLQPLLAEGTRFAINAYGHRIYRLRATGDLAEVIALCGRRGGL